MVEMNINTVLEGLGINDVVVSHYDMGSATRDLADVFFVGRDLAECASHLGDVVVLDSIIDMDELKEKIQVVCTEKGLL